MRAILCTLLKVERCVIVHGAPWWPWNAAQAGRRRASPASIVVRGPVEDAAEELGADEARRDGREGCRLCDEGGVVDDAPETREERRRHRQSHVRRVIQRVARQDQRGHRALGLGPPRRRVTASSCGFVSSTMTISSASTASTTTAGGVSSSTAAPRARPRSRQPGVGKRSATHGVQQRQQRSGGGDAWPSSQRDGIRRDACLSQH